MDFLRLISVFIITVLIQPSWSFNETISTFIPHQYSVRNVKEWNIVYYYNLYEIELEIEDFDKVIFKIGALCTAGGEVGPWEVMIKIAQMQLKAIKEDLQAVQKYDRGPGRKIKDLLRRNRYDMMLKERSTFIFHEEPTVFANVTHMSRRMRAARTYDKFLEEVNGFPPVMSNALSILSHKLNRMRTAFDADAEGKERKEPPLLLKLSQLTSDLLYIQKVVTAETPYELDTSHEDNIIKFGGISVLNNMMFVFVKFSIVSKPVTGFSVHPALFRGDGYY